MRTRNLSIAAIAAALIAAILFSWGFQPVPQVTASYKEDTTCGELVDNGGFETTSGWIISTTPFPAGYSTDEAHSGKRSMRLGILPGQTDAYAYSSVYQEITIPADAAGATLSFWYVPHTEDSSGDLQQVILYSTSWLRLETVLQVLSDDGVWIHHTLDVSDYAGQTLYLYFNVYNDGDGRRSWVFLDDVSLDLCGGVTPTDTPTPTPTGEGTVCDDLADNGGFEVTGYWDIPQTGPFPADYSTTTAYSGDRSMRLGIPSGYYDRESWSSIYQEITVPEDATEATLTFWYKPYTVEFWGDYQYAALLSGPPPAMTMAEVMDKHSDSRTWTERIFDMSEYAGQTVYLYFTVYNDGDGYTTWMYVDDVSVIYCKEAGGEPTDTPTPTGTPTPTATPDPGAPTTEIGFSPTHRSVFTHTSTYTFTTNVVITDVQDLAGFEFDVVYDPDVVEVMGVVLGDFLGSTGKDLLSGSEAGNGRWSFWGAAMEPDEPPLPDGSGILATTLFSPIGVGDTAVTLENAKLARTEEITIPFTSTGGSIVVSCFGDSNGDGGVDVLDILAMATRWHCERGEECYDALYDVDGDGEIRATDIMLVAASWGVCGSETSALLQGVSVGDAPSPKVRIDPNEASVVVGETFMVTVEIEDAQDLGMFQFDLHYDPDLVQVSQVELGSFLGSTGRNVINSSDISDPGVISIDGFTYPKGGLAGPNGYGDLAHIWLCASNIGEGTLQFESIWLYNTQYIEQVPDDVQGAEVKAPGVYLPLIVRQ